MENSRIMIIEDDLAIRESLSMILQEEGASVVTAGSSSEALKIIQSNPEFDIVVLDWFIEGDTKGWALIDLIRNRDPNVKIVVLSGSPDVIAEIEQKSDSSHGVLIGIQKPILNFRSFIDTVSNL